MSATNFTGADFQGAIFKHAKCQWYWPHFPNANLTDADLEGVNFHQKSGFQGAKLIRVNVKRAILTKADLTGADVTGTDFSKAEIAYAMFRDVQGVSEEELSKLQERAARWEYDRLVFFEKLLNAAHALAFFLAPALAIFLGVKVRRRGHTAFQKNSAPFRSG